MLNLFPQKKFNVVLLSFFRVKKAAALHEKKSHG
jgi:hypothetical protein